MHSPDTNVIVGLDVGKHQHHAVIAHHDGTVLLSRAVANTEAALTEMFTVASARGSVVLVVDQSSSIGALAVAVAQTQGIPVAYLPGRTMRQVATTFPGEAKTDARDAWIIAEAARTMPHTIRALAPVDARDAEVRQLSGFDEDLVRQATALRNRLRGLLSQVHPPLERVVGPKLAYAGLLAVLEHWPCPAHLRQAGAARIRGYLQRRGSRCAARLATEIMTALAAQTVEVPGTGALVHLVPCLARQLQELQTQRQEVQAAIETRMATHPVGCLIRSLVGFGPVTTTQTVVALSGKDFASAAHLASYAGVAPVTWQSGSSIRSHRRSRTGNKRLRNAMYQAALSSLHHPPSRAYYRTKRDAGMRHEQALLALARRRVDVLYAMLRDGTMYQPPDPPPPLTKT